MDVLMINKNKIVTNLRSGVLFSMLVLLSAGVCSASEENSPSELIASSLHELRYGSTQELDAYVSGVEAGTVSQYNSSSGALADDLSDGYGNVFAENNSLSPIKAGILSLILPGAGQFYAKSHPAKIGGFVAAEAFFWLKYKNYQSDADDQIIEFEHYADSLWSEAAYWRYVDEVYGASNDSNLDDFTHHLPGTTTQQYYEMIGKYNQFSYGWADPDTITYALRDDHRYGIKSYPSERRLTYNDMRARTNDLFASRDRMLAFAVVNHFVSAIDAVLAASRYNRKENPNPDRLSFSPAVRPGENWSIVPYLDVAFRF